MKSHSIVTAAALATVVLALSGCAASGPVAVSSHAASPSATSTPTATPTPQAALGSRANPFPVGTEGKYDPASVWTFTGQATNPDATAEVIAGNQFNQSPPAGQTYVKTKFTIALANMPEVANGADPGGSFRIAYVGNDGNTYQDQGCTPAAPEMNYGSLGTMYGDATATGVVCVIAPAAAIPGAPGASTRRSSRRSRSSPVHQHREALCLARTTHRRR
jgi:hypothetical protein